MKALSKPKEMKQHIKAEEAALKRGGASPKLMAQERAEWKSEGYKCGGAVHKANGGPVTARATVKSHGSAC